MARSTVSLSRFSDHAPWLADGRDTAGGVHLAPDIKAMLGRVIASELTDLQRELIHEYYDEQKTITEIAKARGVNKSSVSRGLKTARERIGRAMKYGSYRMWREDGNNPFF